MTDMDAEQQLFARAKSTNEGFAELFDKCYDRVYRYAYRRVRVTQVAEDIAECVFEDALKGIDKAQWQGKPIIAWLFRIASRRVSDYYRTRETAPIDVEIYEENEHVPNHFIVSAEARLEVRTALAKLSAGNQEIIRLTYFDELDPEEIAALLGISKNNVYVRLHRALGQLEKQLRSHRS